MEKAVFHKKRPHRLELAAIFFQMPVVGDQVHNVTEKFTFNSCIGVDKIKVVSCQKKTRKVATTDEHLVNAAEQLKLKLKSLQQTVALHLVEEENLLFQLNALGKQLEQRNSWFEDLKSQWNVLRECAEGHKKSVEDLQRRNGRLLQQSGA